MSNDNVKNNIQQISQYKYSLEKEAKIINLSDYFDIEHDLKFMAKGFNTYVYKLNNANWVIKEGRWDFNPIESLLKENDTLENSVGGFQNVNKVITENIQNITKVMGIEYTPTEENIKKQFKEYMKFADFIGNTENTKNLRKDFLDNIIWLCGKYKINKSFTLSQIMEQLDYNFLLEEFMVLGKSLKEPKKNTYFIFQKYFDGNTLHDENLEATSEIAKNRLQLLTLLLLHIMDEESMLADTRPRKVITQAGDWFKKTDNILIQGSDVKFIDTRWFWNLGSGMLRKGLIIPNLFINSAKNTLNLIKTI